MLNFNAVPPKAPTYMITMFNPAQPTNRDSVLYIHDYGNIKMVSVCNTNINNDKFIAHGFYSVCEGTYHLSATRDMDIETTTMCEPYIIDLVKHEFSQEHIMRMVTEFTLMTNINSDNGREGVIAIHYLHQGELILITTSEDNHEHVIATNVASKPVTQYVDELPKNEYLSVCVQGVVERLNLRDLPAVFKYGFYRAPKV